MTKFSKSKTEIETQKAPCAWAALKDRQAKDIANAKWWKPTQLADMTRLLACFVRVFGEDNVVMNINKKFITFKVFQPSLVATHKMGMLKIILAEMTSNYEFAGFNPRNEALYHVYPK
jgi:hypothetical protein